MIQPEIQDAVSPRENRAQRHNQLLQKFKGYWNVYQFFLALNEEIKTRVSVFHPRFVEAFKKFKRCKAGLKNPAGSEIADRQLEVLDRDMIEIKRGLSASDGDVTVDLVRRALEALDPAKRSVTRDLLLYFYAKDHRGGADRDRIDYLITRYFHDEFESLVTPDSIAELEAKIAGVLNTEESLNRPVAPEYLSEYLELLRRIQKITEFGEFLHSGIISKIREYKQQLGDMFYHPSLLARSVLLNGAMRERFEALLQEENQKTEDHIVKLADAGGDLVVQGSDSTLSGMTLSGAQELQKDLTNNLHDEYSKTLDKVTKLDELRLTLERSVAFYGLDIEDTKVGSSFALKFNDRREEDELRRTILDIGMKVRSNAGAHGTVVRFTYKDILVILSSWEVQAFREGPSSSELHLRIRQAVRRTVGLIFVIQGILKQQEELHTPAMPRQLLLALEYYMLKTQELQSTLKELTGEATERGLKLEAFHLSNTQARLTSAIGAVKPLFQKSQTAESLPSPFTQLPIPNF